MITFVYDDGGRKAAGRKGSTGDCVTRAIAVASGRPYQEIYDWLAHGNMTERRSRLSARANARRRTRSASEGIHTSRKWFKEFMRSLGFVWTPTMRIGSGCTVHLKADELPKGRLVVSVSGHYTAVIDGIIHDTYNPDREGTRCVYGYWRLDA